MEDIKKFIKDNVNKEIKVVIDEGRSKKTLKIGIIKNAYDNIFTIIIDNKLMSFSYTDVLIKKINFVNSID